MIIRYSDPWGRVCDIQGSFPELGGTLVWVIIRILLFRVL